MQKIKVITKAVNPIVIISKAFIGSILIIILFQCIGAHKELMKINSMRDQAFTDKAEKNVTTKNVTTKNVTTKNVIFRAENKNNEIAKAEELKVFIIIKEKNEIKILAILLWILVNMCIYVWE